MRRMILVPLALLFLAPALHAACSLNLTATAPTIDGKYTLTWNAVPGANVYKFEESTDDFNNVHVEPIGGDGPTLAVPISHQTIRERSYQYRVTAQNDRDSSFVGCTATTAVTVPADPELKRVLSRSIVAVAGSGPGANGAYFKTYLKLIGYTSPISGRLIFHQAGRIARDTDPSIHYSFIEPGVVEYDDVVAAMGLSGVGMIDIVADEGTDGHLPIAQVRAYNDNGKGTFGSFFRDVMATEWYRPPTGDNFIIPPERFRSNVGIRALTDARILIMLSDAATGHAIASREVELPAGFITLDSVDALVGMHALPGQIFVANAMTGHIFAFHTVTENVTNDPDVQILTRAVIQHFPDYVE